MTSNFWELPPDLPIPSDDGQARHLQGLNLPHILFPSTAGADVDIGAISGLLVIYVYPMTGRLGVALPEGWDSIPGARGCTPQSCSFRDHYAELRSLNAVVFGLSAQTREYQQEAKQRLHLPFDLLSDVSLKLRTLLSLPTFHVAGMQLYKRLTLIARDGLIEKVFYPVFPPDRNIDDVMRWLQENR